MRISSSTARMKKIILLILFLFASPVHADSVSGIGIIQPDDATIAPYLLVDGSNQVKIYSRFVNSDLVLTRYYQLFVGMSVGANICLPYHTAAAGSSNDFSDIVTFPDLTDRVFKIQVDSAPNNSTDTDDCLTDKDTFLPLYTNSRCDIDCEIKLTDSIGGGGVIVSSTTLDTTINNPTLDWFLGFVIFFMCMIFPIWLFRRQ